MDKGKLPGDAMQGFLISAKVQNIIFLFWLVLIVLYVALILMPEINQLIELSEKIAKSTTVGTSTDLRDFCTMSTTLLFYLGGLLQLIVSLMFMSWMLMNMRFSELEKRL